MKEQNYCPEKSRWFIVFLLFFAVLLAFFARMNVSLALPFISGEYAWALSEKGIKGGLLLGAFVLSYGLSNIFLGPLADILGSKKCLLASVILWSVSTSLGAIFGSIYLLFLASRVLLGVAQGILFPIASKITHNWFPFRERSRANAVYQSGSEVANLLAPLLLVPLIMVTSWRVMFHFVALGGFVICLPLALYLKETPSSREVSPVNISVTFLELKKVIKNRSFRLLTVAFSMINIVWWGLSLWLPTYLIEARGFTIKEMALGVALPYLGGIVGMFGGSWMGDRTGRRVSLTILGFLAAAFLFSVILLVHSKIVLLVILTIIMFFLASIPPNVYTLAQLMIPSRVMSTGTGLINGLGNAVGVLGPIIMGLLIAWSGNYNVALSSLMIFLGLGIFSLLSLAKEEKLQVKNRGMKTPD